MYRRMISILGLLSVASVSLSLLTSVGLREEARATEELSTYKLWASYWSVAPGFSSVLSMKNNRAEATIPVQVSLYFATGEEYYLEPLQLGPRQTVAMSINEVFDSLPPPVRQRAGNEGTLEVGYTATNRFALMGSVSVRNLELGAAWNFRLYERHSALPIVPIGGLFWFPDAETEGFVAAQNTSEEFINVAASFEVAGDLHSLPSVRLAPGQGYKFELRKELRKLGLEEVNSGGIQFSYDSARDALIAHGVLFNRRGFSAEIDFHRLDTAQEERSFYLRTPRFAVGPADPRLGLPEQTRFHPTLVLHNFGTEHLPLRLSVGYQNEAGAQQAKAILALASKETRVVSLDEALDLSLPEGTSWAGLEISYKSQGTQLAGALVSVSEDGEHSLVSVLNPVEGNVSEGWYWRAEADSNTLIGILNTDTEETSVQVSLDYYFDGVKHQYNLPEISIPGGVAELVDVGAVIAAGQPDDDGDLIPLGVTYGGYLVRKSRGALDKTLISEALFLDRRTKNYLTFYNTCCGYWNVSFSPDSIAGAVGDTDQLKINATDSCSLAPVNLTAQGSYSSANESVATVDGGGKVTLVGAGSTTTTSSISYFWASPICKDPYGCDCIFKTDSDDTPVDSRDLDRFRITVTSTPVSGETNSVVSGQSAQVRVEAIDNTGAVFTDYRGTVSFSSSDTMATLPANYTYTSSDAGSHTFNVTLKTISGTSASRDFKVTDVNNGVSTTKNIFVWFSVTMDVEFWKNCDFVSCEETPLGSYFCQTAYDPDGWPQKTEFVALTHSSTSLANKPVTVRKGTARRVTFVGDAGPVLNRPYWNTGETPPDIAGCVTDLLADNLGIDNGCTSAGTPFGRGTVFWRFGQ